MANLWRIAKSGSEWSHSQLMAYNIEVATKKEGEFFGSEANSALEHVSRTLLEYEFVPGAFFPGDIERTIPYMDMASRGVVGQESAVDDFAKELLRAIGFESDGRIIRTRYTMRLLISGIQSSAQTDICILRMSGDTLLLLQEDKMLEIPKDPEPQVIAEAIAAFQNNNRAREARGEDTLNRMVIPCITMVGTSPTFYLVPVTAELNTCVERGQCPINKTVVLRHLPRVPRRVSDGMKSVENRRKILQCLEAFKRFVDELEVLLESGLRHQT